MNFVKPFEVPRYVIDANPLLSTYAEQAMPILRQVNRRNDLCVHSTKRRRQPFMIMCLRHPLSRLVSYYTHFIVRRRKSLFVGQEEGEDDDNNYELVREASSCNKGSGCAEKAQPVHSRWGSLEKETLRELACLNVADKEYKTLSEVSTVFASSVIGNHTIFDFSGTYAGARAVIAHYEEAKQRIHKCLGRRSLVLDGIYLPQLLSLLYPESKERERT